MSSGAITSEALRRKEQGLKTENGAVNWLIDRIADSVQPDGRGGTKTTGGWGWVGDRLNLDSTEIRERRAASDTRRGVERGIGASGRTEQALQDALGRPLQTEDDVKAATVLLAENKEQGKINDNREFVVSEREAANNHALAVLGEQNKNSNEQLRAQIAAGDRKADQTARLSLAQLQLGQLQANNQMEIAQMNNRLQMRREDAKEARLERRDRQAAIQQMMAGLAQLGASIAI